jgi:hypothetical protein
MSSFGSKITNSGNVDRLSLEQKQLKCSCKNRSSCPKLVMVVCSVLDQKLSKSRLPASLSIFVISVLNLFFWFLIIGFGWLLLRFWPIRCSQTSEPMITIIPGQAGERYHAAGRGGRAYEVALDISEAAQAWHYVSVVAGNLDRVRTVLEEWRGDSGRALPKWAEGFPFTA